MIDLLAGFCVLVALGAALVAGVFTGRRRAAEARLSLVGGEPRPLFFARAGIEATLPAIVGSAAGFATAVELVRLFTPQGSVDASVVREAGARVGAAAVASMLAVAVGTTLARGRIGGGSTALSRVGAHPVGGVRVVAAVVSWLVLFSGGGLVRDPVAGSHPRLVVLLLPALVAAPLTGISGRLLRSLVLRRVMVASARVSRPAACCGGTRARDRADGDGGGRNRVVCLRQHPPFLSGANVTEKAFVANGSDVQGLIDPALAVPRSFPYPVTKALDTSPPFPSPRARPSRCCRRPAEPRPRPRRALAGEVRSAVRVLASSEARLPALAVGSDGRAHRDTRASQADVQVVSRSARSPACNRISRSL